MKAITLLSPLLMMGCFSYTPKNMYVHPEKYRCDLMIATRWNESFPVEYFQHKMKVGQEYTDVHGMTYTLIPTGDSTVYAIQVSVPKP